MTKIEVVAAVVVITVLVFFLSDFLNPDLGPRESSARTKAATYVRTARQAILAYHADYGHYPKVSEPRSPGEKFIVVGEQPAIGCKDSNAVLFDTLRAVDRGKNANHALNPKKQKYIALGTATDTANPRDGFVDGSKFPAELQGRLYDPWGTQCCIVMETDGDNTLDLGSIYADLSGSENAVNYGVVAFSLGKDGALGGKGYPGLLRKPNSSEAPDDILSWSN